MQDLVVDVEYKNIANEDLSYLSELEEGRMFKETEIEGFGELMGVPIREIADFKVNVRRLELKTRTVSYRFLLKKKAGVSRFSTDLYQLEKVDAHIKPVSSSVVLMMSNEPVGEWQAGSVATLTRYVKTDKGYAWFARFEDGKERLLEGDSSNALVLTCPKVI